MAEDFHIQYFDEPTEAMSAAIGGGLRAFNFQQVGDHHFKRLCFVLYDPGGEIAGGVTGETYWGWLFVNLLFVREDLRGDGFGGRLLSMAEEEGRKRGARHAYLDTFSFQAPEFYQKHGYTVFGELEDFPEGHRRYFLTKRLED